MKALIILLILTIFIAGCTTGQVTTQPTQPQQPAQSPVAPTPQPQPGPAGFECTDNSQCPTGQSCLSNNCVKIQFVK